MRRSIRTAIATFALLVPAAALAQEIAMRRDPGCGCCAAWAAQVAKQFRGKVQIVDDANRPAFQRKVGVPGNLNSCHTAIIDGMAFEGHVPMADMKRVLAERPGGVKGLAVAGMPIGSAGMEVPGVKAQRYEVIAFGANGSRVYARHGG